MIRFHTHRRQAFTLLEVLLALGLTVIVMALVGTAMNTTLRLVEAGRVRTERDQLARAILAKIADDVRSSVRTEPFDATGMMKLSTSTSTSSSQGGQTSSTGSGGTGSSGSSGTGGSSSGGSNSGTSGTSGTGSSQSSGASSSSSSSSTSSSNTTSSTAAVVSTTIAGLVGDDTGLQIDIGRIPRLDEYSAVQSGNQSSPPVSDVRRVMYYLANGASSIVPVTAAAANSQGGLVRSELNHASAQYSVDTGGDATSESKTAVVAPEVLALEFSYFDGSEWVSAWDTTTYNGLPQLLKISIALSSPSPNKKSEEQSFASVADAADKDPDNVYSVVVRLPACDPIPAAGSGGSSSGSSSSASSGTSGTSSTGGSTTGSGSTSAN